MAFPAIAHHPHQRLPQGVAMQRAPARNRGSVGQLLVAGVVDWALALTLALVTGFILRLGPLSLIALSLPFMLGGLSTRSPGGLVSGIAIVSDTTGQRLTPLRAVARVVVLLGLTVPTVFVTWAALMTDMALIGSAARALGAGWILDEEHLAWFVLPALVVTFGIAAAGEAIGRRIGAGVAPWDRAAHSRIHNVRPRRARRQPHV